MEQRICLFPGTFDPITNGHVDVIKRSVNLFDEIVIGLGVNSNKTPMYSLAMRMHWIQEIFKEYPNVKVASYEGLTIKFAAEIGANFILRGIRSVADFEYEKGIADMNRMLYPEIETFFLMCSPEYSTISSTLVREVIKYEHDVARYVPEIVNQEIIKKFSH